MFLPILFVAALIPIILLCVFVYLKDKNKEPKGLLVGIFFLGFISVFPIVINEMVFSVIFPMPTTGFVPIFFNVLFGVAFYEEGYKWLITKYLGYKNKEFDEVYDVIIYAVFASLGFACFENIMYVIQNGLGNAVMRALLAVPGHTCFAISMGYFFAKAKVGEISGNKGVYNRNMVFSIVVPIVLHTLYDAFLFSADSVDNFGGFLLSMLPFLIFYIAMVILCFLTVDKIAKVQQNLTTNIDNGNILRDEQGHIYYNYASPAATQPVSTVVDSTSLVPIQTQTLAYCPICGKPTNGTNFCIYCGFRLK